MKKYRKDKIEIGDQLKPIPKEGEKEEHLRFAGRFARKTKSILEDAWNGFGNEAIETKDMSVAFFRLLEHKLRLNEREEPPSKEEVKEAIEQLKDIGRLSVFASVSILPGGGVSLLGLELLARKMGIKNFTFIPSSFRRRNKIEKNEGSNYKDNSIEEDE
jgi:hypothetical protein